MIPPRIDPSLIRVASYNVRKCIGLDRRRTPERTLDVVCSLDADLVALQEADMRLGRRPSAIPRGLLVSHTGMKPVPIASNDVSLGWHGNAILVRNDARITDVDRLELPSFEPRGAALAEMDLHGRSFRVVATHLGLMRRHRRRQLAELMWQLAKRPPMPTIILGDLNEWARRRGLEPLFEKFDVHSPGNTFHTSRPVAAYDRIALSAEWQIEASGVQRMGPARRASDHLPIWADLSMR